MGVFKVQRGAFSVTNSSVLHTAAGNNYESCFPLKLPTCLLTKVLLLWNKGVNKELHL